MLPTIKLDNPHYWGLVSFPPRRPENVAREQDRFIYHSFDDLHQLFLSFGGADWMAFKKLGQLSVDAAVLWAETFDHTLLNWTPWGFWYSPVAVGPDNVQVARLYIERTTEDQFNSLTWDAKIDYIMTVHVINSQFVLRLRHEVRVLTGLHQYGRPRKHNP